MLSLFPDERPDYSGDFAIGSDEPFAESKLLINGSLAQAFTEIRCGDRVFRGIDSVGCDLLTDKLMSDRLLQRIIKQSFYRAAGDFIEKRPVWGSLTGIRPAHIAAKLLESGASPFDAISKMESEYYVSPERAAICVEAAQASLETKRALSPRDIALYVGIPFCPTRCTYCSFVSNSVENSFDMIAPFAEVLRREIEIAANLVNEHGLRVTSVYFGGGTPTTLPETELESVLSTITDSFDLSAIAEFTFEAGRPDTITKEKLEIVTHYGAKRICVNPQSMSDTVLKAIGRIHSAQDVFRAAELVRSSGAALNMDIIAGLPNDSPESFENTIDTILGLKPENITVHTLSLKKGSKITLEGTVIPSGNDVGLMLDYASKKLRQAGHRPYYLYRQKFTSGGFENIGWSLPGYEGFYNICMMEELCTVLALGGGGVTKLVSPHGRIDRVFNAKYPREYILFTEKLENKYEKIRNFAANEF